MADVKWYVYKRFFSKLLRVRNVVTDVVVLSEPYIIHKR